MVDDEIIVRQRLKAALEKEGHLVATNASGEELLRELELCPFELIFLDIALPGLDGMEVLRRVKARLPETEVIMISGRASLDAAI